MTLKKERKLNRWLGYDYSWPGLYFVTICTKNKQEFFGEIKNNQVYLNDSGQVALKYWIKIPEIYNNVELDEYMIMPNHIHGILIINENKSVGTEHCSVPTKTKHNKMGFLSQIIKFYKEAVTKDIKRNNSHFAWQRSFYDRVIRSEKELNNIREYINNNSINWDNDQNNP